MARDQARVRRFAFLSVVFFATHGLVRAQEATPAQTRSRSPRCGASARSFIRYNWTR